MGIKPTFGVLLNFGLALQPRAVAEPARWQIIESNREAERRNRIGRKAVLDILRSFLFDLNAATRYANPDHHKLRRVWRLNADGTANLPHFCFPGWIGRRITANGIGLVGCFSVEHPGPEKTLEESPDGSVNLTPESRTVWFKRYPLHLFVERFLDHREEATYVDISPLDVRIEGARTQYSYAAARNRSYGVNSMIIQIAMCAVIELFERVVYAFQHLVCRWFMYTVHPIAPRVHTGHMPRGGSGTHYTADAQWIVHSYPRMVDGSIARFR